MNRVLNVTVIALALGLTGFLCVQTASADLLKLDSADFADKFDMDTDPTAGGGWTTGGSLTYSVADGVMTLASPGYLSGVDAWTAAGISTASGYTIEMRTKILTSTGFNPYLCLNPDSGSSMGLLAVGATRQEWNVNPADANFGAMDNTDAFHNFRIAQAPGANTFTVWRDGALLGSSIASVYNDPLYRLIVGAMNADCVGSAEIDYIRFTTGAFAPTQVPTPEPSSVILLAMGLIGLLCYAWRKRK